MNIPGRDWETKRFLAHWDTARINKTVGNHLASCSKRALSPGLQPVPSSLLSDQWDSLCLCIKVTKSQQLQNIEEGLTSLISSYSVKYMTQNENLRSVLQTVIRDTRKFRHPCNLSWLSISLSQSLWEEEINTAKVLNIPKWKNSISAIILKTVARTAICSTTQLSFDG